MKHLLLILLAALLLSGCYHWRINKCTALDKNAYYKKEGVKPPKHYQP